MPGCKAARSRCIIFREQSKTFVPAPTDFSNIIDVAVLCIKRCDMRKTACLSRYGIIEFVNICVNSLVPRHKKGAKSENKTYMALKMIF